MFKLIIIFSINHPFIYIMDIDDELEAEIDVIYSGEFADEMSLMQFPLIPKDNFKQSSIASLSVNRKSEALKIEKNIDINYLDQRAPNLTTKQVMNGQRIESNTNLTVGVFRNGALYLTPVSHIYQFRHDFSSIEDKELIQRRKKNDFRSQQQLPKKEDNEHEYVPLQMNYPNTIESCKAIEKIVSVDGYMEEEAKFLSKEEYFNLLLKYINDKSITDELNEKSISPDYEDYMNYKKKVKKEEKKEEQKQQQKEEIDTNHNNQESSIVGEIIIKIFGKEECIGYDSLMNQICSELNIDKSEKQVEQIKKEIENYCIIVSNNTTQSNVCYLKNIGDEEIKEIRYQLIEYLAGNNGVKKQQIKTFLKEKNIILQDNKLNKLLKSIGEYTNSQWVIKSPK